MPKIALGIVMAGIAIAFAGAAVFYFMGGGEEPGQAVYGVVVDKFQRQAGTEAGDKPLEQGLNVLTRKSFKQESYFFLLVESKGGKETEVVVPKAFYEEVLVGDTIQQATPEDTPIIVLDQAAGYDGESGT